MTAVRAFPLRVAPADGEGIDSWMEAIARRNNVPLGAILHTVQLSCTRRPWWLYQLSDVEAETITAATGVARDALERMTLSTYDNVALKIDSSAHRLDPTFPFGVRTWSRFCPLCLTETSGRWQLHWRLGWVWACTRHRCLLLDECPQCAGQQRRTCIGTSPQPRASTPAPPASACTAGCGAVLTGVETEMLSSRHPMITAQRRILQILNEGHTDFGLYAADPPAVRTVLDDIKSFATRALTHAAQHGAQALQPHELHNDPSAPDGHTGVQWRQVRTTARGRPPLAAWETGLGISAALRILQTPNIEAAARRCCWLTETMNAAGAPSPRSFDHESPLVTAIILKSHTAAMGAIAQLRYRTAAAHPAVPGLAVTSRADVAARLPSTLWPAWSVRFACNDYAITKINVALTCATLLVGTALPLGDAVTALGSCVSVKALDAHLFALRHRPYWTAIATALTRLHDYLVTHGSPIDYARRRTLDYTTLLPEQRWQALCRGTGDIEGAGRRSTVAQTYLYQKLSGSPGTFTSPTGLSPNNFWKTVRNFPRSATAQIMKLLDDEAQRFLAEHGIDEPLTWHPPTSLIDDLGLPGPAVDDIDIERMHQLVIDDSFTVGDLADYFTISQHAVRYLLGEHPVDYARRPDTEPRVKLAFRTRLREQLTAQILERLYVQQRLSLAAIADMYAISTTSVQDLLAAHHIPTRTRSRQRPSAEWLREQRDILRRSITDIAADVGVSRPTMSIWLGQLPAATASTEIPPDIGGDLRGAVDVLRPALTSAASAGHLRVFLRTARFASFSQAATALRRDQPSVQDNIRRLEYDFGDHLLLRNSCGLPMRPTTFGQRVVAATQSLTGTVTIPQTSGRGSHRLPFMSEPVAGEALDSYLEHIAHQTAATVGRIYAAAQLRPHKRHTPAWMLALTPAERRGLSHLTGVDRVRLKAMTLEHFDGGLIRIDRERNRLARDVRWGFMAGSRYCPHCLAEKGGRWQLSWRLIWTFVCLRHRCLLADECPDCGQRQRRHAHCDNEIPKPGLCTCPKVKNYRNRCGADLTQAFALVLPRTHPVLDAQRFVNSLTANDFERPALYKDALPSAADVLDDLSALARLAIGRCDNERLEKYLPTDVFATLAESRATRGWRETLHPLSQCFNPTAADVAAGLVVARKLLAQRNVTSVRRHIRRLLDQPDPRSPNRPLDRMHLDVTPTLREAFL